MHSIASRGLNLRAFDAAADEFSHYCRVRFEGGGSLASRDIQRLSVLAERLGHELMGWSGAVGDLEVGAARLMEARRAGRLLIESVFDEVLIPEATRVLAAALTLACPAS